MPIYRYRCDKCVLELEKVQGINEEIPPCPECGKVLVKVSTYPAMVKVKGEGGYPSRRKYVKGTAPYSGSAKEWNPLENKSPKDE